MRIIIDLDTDSKRVAEKRIRAIQKKLDRLNASYSRLGSHVYMRIVIDLSKFRE